MVKAHGGNKNFVSVQKGEALVLGGIVQNTTGKVPKDVHMKGLDRLVSQTTGVPRGEVVMDGVMKSTVPSHMKSVAELHKVPSKEVGKTQTKRMGQVAYAGKMY